MKVKVIIILFFITIEPIYISAQTDSNRVQNRINFKNLSISACYQYGYIFATNDFLRGANIESEKIKGFQAFSLELTKQTKGEKLWEQIYRYPNWGIGVYLVDFFNPEEIGYPIALYGIINAPFKRWERASFNYELGFGATFNWKSYDPITNQYNSAIGAGESFLIDAGLNFRYKLTEKFDLIAGFSLTHFSNGAIKKPNQGINTVSPKITLKYNFFNSDEFIEQKIPEYLSNNEWLISGFGGVKNVIFDSVDVNVNEKYEGVFFPVYGIAAIYNRQLSYKSKIGIGLTASYDGSTNAQIAVDNNEIESVDGPFGDKLQLSIYPSYELVVNKVSLILQPAFYIYRKKLKNQSPVFHQRIGLKYHINNHLFIGITLRDYDFHVSDFIEWNIGYRFKGDKSNLKIP